VITNTDELPQALHAVKWFHHKVHEAGLPLSIVHDVSNELLILLFDAVSLHDDNGQTFVAFSCLSAVQVCAMMGIFSNATQHTPNSFFFCY